MAGDIRSFFGGGGGGPVKATALAKGKDSVGPYLLCESKG